MGFWSEIEDTICKTVDTVIEKNKKAAQSNRLKLVVKKESDAITRAYIALGQHYYKNMRTASNEETECMCEAIDHAKVKINKAKKLLHEINLNEEPLEVKNSCPCCKAEKPEKTQSSVSVEPPVPAQPTQAEVIREEGVTVKEDNFRAAREAAEEDEELIPPLTDLDLPD